MGRFDLASPVSLRTLLEFATATPRVGVEIDVGRWLTRPYVNGIEVTQGIQYFEAARHLTNPDDRGPDNSVRLIARKPAWVRVYVRSGLYAGDQRLTGDLLVEHRTGAFLGEWTTVATLSPRAPGSVLSRRDPDYAVERSTIGMSINFVVGAALMEGMVRFTARIWLAADATRTPVDTWQETVDATLLQTLRLRAVFVHYNGPDPTINATNPPTVDLPAPGLANLQATAAWTLKTNPVEAAGTFSSVASPMNWFSPLTDPATSSGGCSANWAAFNYWLSRIKLEDGNRSDVIYYGLLPANMPVGPVTGCETWGVSAGRDQDQLAMAHEIGHGAKLLHAPCGLPRFLLVTSGENSITFVANPTIDHGYPAYEPYDPNNSPTASIGEYGLDITDGTILPPTRKDYMSYCGPVWISLYHHAKLVYNDAFNPRRVGVQHWEPPDLVDPFLWPWEYIPDPPRWDGRPGDLRPRAEPSIAILGIVDESRTFAVRSVARVQALATTPGAALTPYVAQLLGAEGEVLATAPVVRRQAHGAGCGCGPTDPSVGPFVFEALVPDVAPGAALRIVKRGEEGGRGETVWTREAPGRPPVVRSFRVTVDRGEARARWQARGEGELEFSLQFSKDRGRSWNVVAVGLTGGQHRFPSEGLPSGRLVFRLLAHDGFHSTGRVSRAVEVPRRPPIVSILSPEAGRPFFATAPLRLWGAVTEDDGVPADPEACQWLVDGRPVARGLDVWIVAPAPGRHRCTLVVRGRGGTARVATELRTLDPSETDPRRLAGEDTAARRSRARRASGRSGGTARRRRKGGSR